MFGKMFVFVTLMLQHFFNSCFKPIEELSLIMNNFMLLKEFNLLKYAFLLKPS